MTIHCRPGHSGWLSQKTQSKAVHWHCLKTHILSGRHSPSHGLATPVPSQLTLSCWLEGLIPYGIRGDWKPSHYLSFELSKTSWGNFSARAGHPVIKNKFIWSNTLEPEFWLLWNLPMWLWAQHLLYRGLSSASTKWTSQYLIFTRHCSLW